MKSELGARRPAYCTALGRAIFAYAPDETAQRLLASPMRKRTQKTVVDPKRLGQVLAQVRQRGFAIEDEESEPGIRVVAAPVRDATGAAVGAIGIAGPSQRLTLEAIEGFVPLLVTAAAAVSSRLGHDGSSRR